MSSEQIGNLLDGAFGVIGLRSGWQSAEADLAAIGIKPPVINAIALGVVIAGLDNIRVRILMRRNAALLRGKTFVERVRMAAVARFVRKSTIRRCAQCTERLSIRSR